MEENCSVEIGMKNENIGLEKEKMNEEMSSSSMRKNVSDDNDSEQKAKKSIKFGGWLPHVLDWIKRMELAQSKLSTSSLIFNRYCWPHLHGRKVKPHIVERLTFLHERDHEDEGNCQYILKKDYEILIPIADIEPPGYIIGFESIGFRNNIDERALEFVKNIFPLLKDVKIIVPYIGFAEYREYQQIGPIRQLLEMLASKINKMYIWENFHYDLTQFKRHFPNIIYGIQSIHMVVRKEIDLDLIVKWLGTPREDGKMKMLKLEFDSYYFTSTEVVHVANALIDRAKEEFIHYNESVNFIIWMRYCYFSDDQIGKFKIENDETKEMLELYFKPEEKEYVLNRCNKDDETMPKIDWKEQMERTSDTKICF